MTTREEWLRLAADEIRNDPAMYYVSAYSPVPTILPSFPGRSSRSVLLGDIAHTEETGAPVLLVSPLISSSLEVTIVLYWLLVRRGQGMTDARQLTGRYNGQILEAAGFQAPFKQCVPTERLIDRVSAVVDRVVLAHGEYPSQDVRLAPRATQSTRLLKVACNGHRDPYILRMSQKQFDRGAPACGVCNAAMILA
jgi:hypothetical protein